MKRIVSGDKVFHIKNPIWWQGVVVKECWNGLVVVKMANNGHEKYPGIEVTINPSLLEKL